MSKRSAVLFFAVVAGALLVVQQGLGQAAPDPGAAAEVQYSFLPVNEALKPLDPALVAADEVAKAADAERARLRSAAQGNARKVLAGQIPLDDAGKKILDTWYKSYFLPHFTSPEARGQLPELRDTLLNKDFRTAKSAAAIEYVRGQVMTYMKAYAQSPQPKFNFHPAVRYNAMLVIGGLNAVEYGARYPNEQKALVPDPLPEALDLLISEFKSPAQIDAVRVAAIVGIDRHVKLDLALPADRHIPGAKKKVIFEEMLALLNSSPPAGRNAEGHAWMQRRAIEIIAVLGTVGIKPETNAALEKIVADKDAPISLRCTASEALSKWDPNSNAKIDVSNVSKNLGLIAVKACKDELDRLAALERREKEMKQLRELIKKPNPVASGTFGSMPSGGGDPGMTNMTEGYGGSGGPSGSGGGEQENMYSGGTDIASIYGGEGMYGGGGLLGGNAAEIPADPRIIWSRRRLKYQLTCVKRGLEGMTIAGKASQHAKAVDQVAKAVDAALALTDPPKDKPDIQGLTESIQQGVRGLAFLAPEVAEIGIEPVTDVPVTDVPVTDVPAGDSAPSADPAKVPAVAPAAGAPRAAVADPTAPAADPAAAAAEDPTIPPVADPAAPPADGDLPPGLE